MCCPGGAGLRARLVHNPLVREWARVLAAAGRVVQVEQRDPAMGPSARLDVVEFASEAGPPGCYDVSVVTPLRADPEFVAVCARSPGHAGAERHLYKLTRQYAQRVPGSRLVPLVVEVGGRWHKSVPALARDLAREYVARTPGLSGYAQGAVVARWQARWSALLIRGVAGVKRELAGPRASWMDSPAGPSRDGLCHLEPEGACAYELLVS